MGGQELFSHEATPVPYYIILLAYIYSLLTLIKINLFGVKSYEENHAVRMQIKHLAYFTYFFTLIYTYKVDCLYVCTYFSGKLLLSQKYVLFLYGTYMFHENLNILFRIMGKKVLKS